MEKDEALNPPDTPSEKKISKFKKKVAQNEINYKAKEFFKKGEALLADQFNFYSFGLNLNKD